MATKKVGILVAVAGATIAMGGVYATSLTLDAQQAASGADAVASCQSAPLVFTSADPTYDAASGKYKTASVTVTDIDVAGGAECTNMELRITAVDNSNAVLSTGPAVTIDAASEVFTFSAPVAVEDLSKYVAAITAPA